MKRAASAAMRSYNPSAVPFTSGSILRSASLIRPMKLWMFSRSAIACRRIDPCGPASSSSFAPGATSARVDGLATAPIAAAPAGSGPPNISRRRTPSAQRFPICFATPSPHPHHWKYGPPKMVSVPAGHSVDAKQKKARRRDTRRSVFETTYPVGKRLGVVMRFMAETSASRRASRLAARP